MEYIKETLKLLWKFIKYDFYDEKLYLMEAIAYNACFLYNSDIIKILYYKMARITTDRDYYLRRLLLDGFKEADRTKDRHVDWWLETLLSKETAIIKYYNDILATLFISGDQIYHGPVKFTQIGINENNYTHRYKTFAEMLATIRYIIENHIIRYELWKYDGEIRVWLHIDRKTLVPEIWIYEYNNKTNSWEYEDIFETFDTGVVLDYIGIDMYDINSKTTVSKIKENEKDFKELLDEIIYEHLSATPSKPINHEESTIIVEDKIYVNDTFSFPFYLSHITLAPLIEYLVKFFEIDPYEKKYSSQESVQNYLQAVFEENSLNVNGKTLNKHWYCDFGLLTSCDYDDVEYDKLDNKKELFDKYIKYEYPHNLDSIYQIAWYLFTKDCPREIIDYVVDRNCYFEDLTPMFNYIRLIYDMLAFEHKDMDTNILMKHLRDKTYIDNISTIIENSPYVKQLIYNKLDSKFFVNNDYRMFVDKLIHKFTTCDDLITFDEFITKVINENDKKYSKHKLPKSIGDN